MDDFYTRQTYDWHGIKGDSIFIKIAFWDEEGLPIDLNGFNLKLTLRDPVTDQPLLDIQKSRTGQDDPVVVNGIHCSDDGALAISMGVNDMNQLAVHFTPDETKYLDQEIYEFDLEFSMTGLYDAVFTRRGNLILKRDVTPNV